MEPGAEFDTEWTTKFEDMYGEGRVADFGLEVLCYQLSILREEKMNNFKIK